MATCIFRSGQKKNIFRFLLCSASSMQLWEIVKLKEFEIFYWIKSDQETKQKTALLFSFRLRNYSNVTTVMENHR